jgi:hypothetical protein
MLGKWPNPNKLSGKVAPAGGLWIRRVLVRAQEGQYEARSELSSGRVSLFRAARGQFGGQFLSKLEPGFSDENPTA